MEFYIIIACLAFISFPIIINYFHEAGHFLTAKLFNFKTEGIKLERVIGIPVATNIKILFFEGDNKPSDTAVIAVFMSGPLFSLIPGTIAYLIYPNYLILLIGLFIGLCSGVNDYKMASMYLKRDLEGIEKLCKLLEGRERRGL